SPVRPVQGASGRIDVDVDRFRQGVIKQLDILPRRSRLARRDFDVGAEQATLARLGLALLRPVDLAAFDIDGNAHAMLRRVRPWPRVALAGIDERLDVRTVEVATHHTHAFSVAPVQLSGGLFDLELLWRERTARRNDGRHVPAVEIRTDEGAVV